MTKSSYFVLFTSSLHLYSKQYSQVYFSPVFVSLYSQYLENYLWPNFISSKVCKLLSDV